MKKLIIPIALGVIILVLLFWNVENRELANTYKLEKEQIQRHIKKQIDSVNRVIIRKDEQLLKAMRESAYADMIANEAVTKFEQYKKHHENKKLVSHNSDTARSNAIRSTLDKARKTGNLPD